MFLVQRNGRHQLDDQDGTGKHHGDPGNNGFQQRGAESIKYRTGNKRESAAGQQRQGKSFTEKLEQSSGMQGKSGKKKQKGNADVGSLIDKIYFGNKLQSPGAQENAGNDIGDNNGLASEKREPAK